jgi:zinc finger protein 830
LTTTGKRSKPKPKDKKPKPTFASLLITSKKKKRLTHAKKKDLEQQNRMADVRALLKAKRQEVRITHPYAAYGGANGASLRCTACGVAIKVASAWEGHLGSKAHRVAVANLKSKEEGGEEAPPRRRATTTTTTTTTTGPVSVSKRKAEEGNDGEQMETGTGTGTGTGKKKRQRTEELEVPHAAAAAADDDDSPDADGSTGAGAGASYLAFPANFFSDPARAPPPRTSTGGGQDDEDEDNDEKDQDANANAKTAPKSQFDAEWDAFERDMQNLSHQEQERQAVADPQEMFAHATIAAEPELVSRLEGLPVDGAAQEGTEHGTGTGVEEGGRKVSGEEQERRRKERDERELIMDRLMEEERAQEDAYGRVALLKNRIQMLKQKREVAKAKGKKVAMDTES